MKSKIKREIRTEQRLLEIIDSMINPETKYRIWKKTINGEIVGVPSLSVISKNMFGVVEYRYKHSGLSGMNWLEEALIEHGAEKVEHQKDLKVGC